MIAVVATQGVLVKGLQALDALLNMAAPALAKGWNGDEALVALVAEVRGGLGTAWATREKLIDDLHQRGEREQDPTRKKPRLPARGVSGTRGRGCAW
jgi:hypothetical protein